MKDSTILNTTTYLETVAQGNGLSEIEVLILRSLELIHVGKGIIRCKLLVTDRVAGDDGTWQAGVITAVMDAIGAASVYSTGDGLHSSVDLNASFYSTAKIREKVEVEARVKGTNRRLKSSVIEIRRERDGELLATGRLWMAPLSVKVKHTASSNLMMAASYFNWPQEEEETFEDDIEDDEPYVEPPFDESILTPEQSVKVDELCKESPTSTRSDMAVLLRLNLMQHRAMLEGRELTSFEVRDAHQLKEVFYWVPPTQLEGICDSTSELHYFEDNCLLCVEDIASDLNSHVLINECLDLICETRKLDDLRVEKIVRDYFEVCFDKNYLCASIDLETDFLMLDESRPLLELADLGDELDVDKLLFEIENPLVKNSHENENIVFYLIDEDTVDYFVKTSFEPIVDFVFSPNAFDSHDHVNLKEHFIMHDTSLVMLFDEKSVYFLWTVVCSFAHFVPCVCRRRTKGALAQPFDTYD